jgi:hypothetical protein
MRFFEREIMSLKNEPLTSNEHREIGEQLTALHEWAHSFNTAPSAANRGTIKLLFPEFGRIPGDGHAYGTLRESADGLPRQRPI